MSGNGQLIIQMLQDLKKEVKDANLDLKKELKEARKEMAQFQVAQTNLRIEVERIKVKSGFYATLSGALSGIVGAIIPGLFHKQ